MLLVLRGHIRNSFETRNLYCFVKELYDLYPDLKIFIHTWNVFSNGISWRRISVNHTAVTSDIIFDYFDDIKHCIKHIIIDDDTNIELIGNLHGNIGNGSMPMPVIGWKNYWYGKFRIIDYLFRQNIYNTETVINCRFDVFNNSNNFIQNIIADSFNMDSFLFIKNMVINIINNPTNITKNIFLFNYEKCGIDNIYVGNVYTMHKLTNEFFYYLDDILSKNKDIIHQEYLVYRMNHRLFDTQP